MSSVEQSKSPASDARKQRLRDEALRLGFDACGFAAADEAVDPEDGLGEWLRQGFHADMDWMARTKRLRQDVRLKLPRAQTVIVVAKNYHQPRPAQPPGTGKVAMYAWGRDYHKVMRKPLHALAAAIESFEEGAETWCGIDSAPVLERAWAARAGVGWIGKNSLALRKGLGSYFFLGVIVTTVAFEPDTSVRDACGSCRACIDACPTDAIVEGRMVDSRRCISYQTIENRGEVPREIAERTGDWVFGCDICQEVCPYNRKPPLTAEPDFAPRDGHLHPWLDALTDMDEDAFRRTYAGSPVMRAKHAGMQRNARIAKGKMECS